MIQVHTEKKRPIRLRRKTLKKFTSSLPRNLAFDEQIKHQKQCLTAKIRDMIRIQKVVSYIMSILSVAVRFTIIEYLVNNCKSYKNRCSKVAELRLYSAHLQLVLFATMYIAVIQFTCKVNK